MTEQKPKRTQRKEKAKRAARNVQTSTPQFDGSVVFVGNKPVMNYVPACMTYLNSGSNKIVVKARGRPIPRAVDTIEVLRRSFAKGVQLEGHKLVHRGSHEGTGPNTKSFSHRNIGNQTVACFSFPQTPQNNLLSSVNF